MVLKCVSWRNDSGYVRLLMVGMGGETSGLVSNAQTHPVHAAVSSKPSSFLTLTDTPPCAGCGGENVWRQIHKRTEGRRIMMIVLSDCCAINIFIMIYQQSTKSFFSVTHPQTITPFPHICTPVSARLLVHLPKQ